MARFFLFCFTILLSLSLGLFAGQNYFLDTDEEQGLSAARNSFEALSTDIKVGFKNSFNSLMDKIFANEELEVSDKIETKDQADLTEPNETSEETSDLELEELHEALVKEYTSTDKEKNSNPVQKTVVATEKNTKALEDKVKTIAPGETGWVIQVAAFQEISDAVKVEEQIKEFGFPHYFYKTSINDQIWYRVNIGPFKTVADATNFKQTKKVHLKFKGAFVRKL